MGNDTKLAGGCMCGAVRFEATGESFGVAHCHCHSCRKHNGGPVVTLAGYTADRVTFSGEARKIYESSPGGWPRILRQLRHAADLGRRRRR